VSTPPPLPLPKSDFADWINPLLIKELRQGLRAKVFLVSFLLMTVGLSLAVLIAVNNDQRGAAADLLDGSVWTLLGLFVGFIMPVRCLSMISEEQKQHTLELLQMSGISPFRIALGKWLAVQSLSFLLLITTLPFLVVRYFFGSMDVEGAMMGLLACAGSSLLLGAVFLYFSTFGKKVSWIIIPGFTFGSQIFTVVLFGFGSKPDFPPLLHLTLMVPLACLFFLLLTADRIAPEAEKSLVPLRQVALLCLAVGAVLSVISRREVSLFYLALPAALCLWQGLTRAMPLIDSRHPWAEKNAIFGALHRWFFAPGWATSVFYGMLCVAIYYGACELNPRVEQRTLMQVLVFLPALWLPLILLRPWLPQRSLLWPSLGIFALLLPFHWVAISNVLQNGSRIDLAWLDSFTPQNILLGAGSDTVWQSTAFQAHLNPFGVAITLIIAVLALLLATRSIFRPRPAA
jgi:ABC-type transport system involved in multi-copper enzyme maturation permease subunit